MKLIENNKIHGVDYEYLMTKERMPFGKYRDKPLSKVLEDEGYCTWLLNQSWIKDWPFIHEMVMYKYPNKTEKKK